MRSLNNFNSVKSIIKTKLFYLFQRCSYSFSPRSINLDISWACNLDCVMCSVRERISGSNKDYLTVDNFKNILSQLPQLKFIDFMGLGEPLMNPYFFNLLDIAHAKNIKASLITNGMLLNKDSINKIKDNLVRIYISMDTPVAEKLEKIRKGVQFARLIDNIHNLKKLKPNIKLGFLVVLMQETAEDLPALVELARDIGIGYIGVNHLLCLDKFNDERRVTVSTDKAKYYLEKAEDLAGKHKIDFVSRPLQPNMRTCWQPWLEPLIMLNGDIHPCCFMDQSAESVCAEWFDGVTVRVPFNCYKMGNIFQGNFKKIWNGKDFRNLRKTLRNSEIISELTPGELNSLRQKVTYPDKFWYCRICLWRWSMAC